MRVLLVWGALLSFLFGMALLEEVESRADPYKSAPLTLQYYLKVEQECFGKIINLRRAPLKKIINSRPPIERWGYFGLIQGTVTPEQWKAIYEYTDLNRVIATCFTSKIQADI